MNKRLIIFIFLFICFFCSRVMASPADKYTSDDYFRLLKQAKNQDPKLDFTALRLSYTKTKMYEPYGTRDLKGMKTAYDIKNFAKTLSIAEGILKTSFVDIDAHLFCMLVYREKKDKKKESFHKYMFDGLLYSLLQSGEGDSPKNAFIVINIHEEYSIFRATGVTPGKQKLEQIDGMFYDKWQVKHPRTGEHVFYFNIDIPFRTQEARMKKLK